MPWIRGHRFEHCRCRWGLGFRFDRLGIVEDYSETTSMNREIGQDTKRRA